VQAAAATTAWNPDDHLDRFRGNASPTVCRRSARAPPERAVTAIEVVLVGVAASTLAGLCTALGAAGVAFIRSLAKPLENVLLSLAAGIMLAASVFSLLLPALERAGSDFESKPAAVLLVIAGLLAGAACLHLLHSRVPHEHFGIGREGPDPGRLARIWLFVIAITLHNFPEGMAVGVSFGGGDLANGTSTAIGIGLQNIPEGLAVAVSLLAVGYGRAAAFGAAALTGLAEPVGGLVGSAAAGLAEPALPLTLAFSAGAMLFIISDEVIPETHRRDTATHATFALLGGFAVMMFLDTTLG